MRFWGYLAAKLAAFGLLAYGGGLVLRAILPEPDPFYSEKGGFAHDIWFTFAFLIYALFCAGLLYLIIWDQRYRCRTCLRRLRMPIATGSWSVLFSRPRTEYICAYGHGTLKVEELQITGRQEPDWHPNDNDIWKELFPEEEAKR